MDSLTDISQGAQCRSGLPDVQGPEAEVCRHGSGACLDDEICGFLDAADIAYDKATVSGLTLIDTGYGIGILPLEITAKSPEEASAYRIRAGKVLSGQDCSQGICSGRRIIAVAEDRWRSEGECIRRRLLTHLGRFVHVFARNCEVRRIRNDEAKAFMDAWHSYGSTVCRYRYGLFLKKAAGNGIAPVTADPAGESTGCMHTGYLPAGTMVAAATFSNGRLMERGGRMYRSYQWIRYASLPDVRVAGGMGKIMAYFLADAGIRQDDGDLDIMSYADLEWSDGGVYRELGFRAEDRKSPVMYAIDPADWKRCPVSRLAGAADGRTAAPESRNSLLYFENFGSIRYRYVPNNE